MSPSANRRHGFTLIGLLVVIAIIALDQFNPNYVQYFIQSQISWPARIFTFMDEHPDSINDRFFVNSYDDMKWNNLPASYHNGSAHLHFADGHVESHRWTADTIRPAQKGGYPVGFVPNVRTDWEWLKERAGEGKP